MMRSWKPPRAGHYDETMCAGIAAYHWRGDADLVICQYLLDPLRDAGRRPPPYPAFSNLAVGR
jgi:hypothetical protein